MAKAVKTPITGVNVPPLQVQMVEITLIGDSALICHAWSAKAKKRMLAKQTGAAKEARERKNPHNDFLESLYQHPDGGYGFPTVAFKSAAVDACSHVEGVTKVVARGAFHIDGELLRIISPDPTMREDMVRVGMGTADIRYRGQFNPWSVTMNIRVNTGVLTVAQLIQLFDTAGFAIGVGEWRPQRDGQFGLFHVARAGDAS